KIKLLQKMIRGFSLSFLLQWVIAGCLGVVMQLLSKAKSPYYRAKVKIICYQRPSFCCSVKGQDCCVTTLLCDKPMLLVPRVGSYLELLSRVAFAVKVCIASV
ncbi:hypothetical protein U1Q18_001198, partial [Sarracenia purpurea var. burkii]